MKQEELATALALERQMYQALSETASLTVDLSEAVSRQDSESVRLFLRMRQEQIDRLVEHDGALRRLCDGLTQERDCLRMRELLEGKAQGITPEEEPLFQQVAQNLAVLARVRQADASVNRKLCRQDSFYGT